MYHSMYIRTEPSVLKNYILFFLEFLHIILISPPIIPLLF